MNKIISLAIQWLKENKRLLYCSSYIYNAFYSPSTIFGGGRIKISGAFLRKVKITVKGKNNCVTISPKVMMNNCVISVIGNNCNVYIEGGGTNIHYCNIEVRGFGSEVIIKKGFTSESVSLKACEGKKITIGQDCMFSAGIYISTTDFHSIFNTETNERLNPAKDVLIGKHVWLAHGVSVLKGSAIADHIIVGKSSIVTGKLIQTNSIYAGIPAKMVKTGVDWRR